jgi:small subunit ribosomal protein S6
MPFYEHVYMARQDLTPQAVEALTETLKGIVEANGGQMASMESWGVRTLAYRIAKNRKAHYVLMNLEAPPAAIAELERQQKINEDVLRFMTVKVEALEGGQSAMMRSRDRDDRRRDGDDRGFGDRPERGDRGDRGDRPRRDRDAA